MDNMTSSFVNVGLGTTRIPKGSIEGNYLAYNLIALCAPVG